MTILQEVHLNQSSWKIPPVVHAVQNDSGRSLKMIIEDETIPSGSTATLSILRADDTHYDITGATLNTADNSFTVNIEQALTCPGETKCQLKVSGIVSTYTFIIDVQHDASGVVSPQEGISLTEAVEAAEDAADRAEYAAESIELLELFEMGNITITWNGWSYSDSDSRVRTIFPIYLTAGQKIGLKSYEGSAQYYLGWLKADGTYGTAGWLSSDFTVSESGYYVVLISNFQTQTDKTALASLFFGYTLNDKVNDLHTEFNLSTSDGWEKYKFEKRQYSTGDGEFYASNIRLSITQRQYVKDGGYVIARPGYYVALLLYNLDGTLLSDSGWKTSIAIPTNSLACITLRRVDDGAITLDERVNCRIIFNNFSSSFEVANDANKIVCQNIKGINHRGWHEAPENTLVAYRESRRHGFKYVETDVRWTSDGVPVLLHDASINRTAKNANGTEISGTVNITDITFAQSQTYDFGIYKGDQYAGEKIPKFEDFIILCRNLGLHPYIEMVYGTSGVTESQVLTLVNIVKRLGMVKNVTWICVSPTYLGYVKKYEPFARLGIVANDLTESLIDDVNDLRDTYGDIFTSADNDIFVDVFYTSITNAEIELCIENGIEIEVWTVDTESAIRSLDPYVTGVTSNKYNAANVLYDSNIY